MIRFDKHVIHLPVCESVRSWPVNARFSGRCRAERNAGGRQLRRKPSQFSYMVPAFKVKLSQSVSVFIILLVVRA